MLKTEAKSAARVLISAINPEASPPEPTILSANALNLTAALLKSTADTPRVVEAVLPNSIIAPAEFPKATFRAFTDSPKSEATFTLLPKPTAIPANAVPAIAKFRLRFEMFPLTLFSWNCACLRPFESKTVTIGIFTAITLPLV